MKIVDNRNAQKEIDSDLCYLWRGYNVAVTLIFCYCFYCISSWFQSGVRMFKRQLQMSTHATVDLPRGQYLDGRTGHTRAEVQFSFTAWHQLTYTHRVPSLTRPELWLSFDVKLWILVAIWNGKLYGNLQVDFPLISMMQCDLRDSSRWLNGRTRTATFTEAMPSRSLPLKVHCSNSCGDARIKLYQRSQ